MGRATLSVGKRSSFVVLGADPMRVDAGAIKDISVEQTWHAGRCVFDAGVKAARAAT